MCPMAILTGNVGFLMIRDSLDKLRMKGVFDDIGRVAAHAVDRFNLRLMGNIVGIETCMAGYADKLFMRRTVKERLIGIELKLFSILLLRQRRIAVAGEAIRFRLSLCGPAGREEQRADTDDQPYC